MQTRLLLFLVVATLLPLVAAAEEPAAPGEPPSPADTAKTPASDTSPGQAASSESDATAAVPTPKKGKTSGKNQDPSKWDLKPMTAKQFKNAWPYYKGTLAQQFQLTDEELEAMRKEGATQTGTKKRITVTLPERVAKKRARAQEMGGALP